MEDKASLTLNTYIPTYGCVYNVGESGVRRTSAAGQNGPPAFWPKAAVPYAGSYTSHLCPCLSESCRSYGGASRHSFRVIRPNVPFQQNPSYMKGRRFVKFMYLMNIVIYLFVLGCNK